MPPASTTPSHLADSSARSRRERWRAWLSALGPGAIVASLTIGTGELIFSSRAGSLFGYRVLGWFALVLLFKWCLVLGSARAWVFTGVHPLRHWAGLPGPRGWLSMTLLVVALPAFPVWVSFHSGTIGTLMAAITGTREALGGNASLVWGVVVLLTVLVLAATGGYARQERFQTVVVATMLLSVIIALVLLRPDWWGFVSGFFRWPAWQYPEWAAALPEFKDRPVWVEAATYAGVVGGSGYDYLAYVAWLRDKHGVGSARQVGPLELNRLVLADATVSFVCVLLFSAVFVACGHILLGPRHQIPAGADLLTLQAQFVGFAGAWLKPLYFLGAFLALGGTLYGTIEVAPAILRELVHSVKRPDQVSLDPDRLRRWAVRWCGVGALVILILTLAWRLTTGAKEPFNLVALLTPANLFTGVLACGWISLLNVWADRRVATGVGRMSWPLRLANLVGGVAFSFVGLKAAWDQAGAMAFVVLVGCVAAGWGLAAWRERSR